jgi:threonine dehydrogenase-like Zn-dependent dehydrogenase
MGIVTEVASEVRDIKVGDRVVVSFDISCGKCDFCQREEYSGCSRTNNSKVMEKLFGHTTGGMHGYGNLLGGYSGGQAEFMRVPYADVNCLKIPPEVPDEKALFLSDIACTSFHAAIELGKVKQGDTVAIWGAGPIGILSAKWCELFGARLIIVIDDVPDRLNLVKGKIRNVETINFDECNVKEAIERLCPGGTDVAIEAAGFRYAKSVLHKIERKVGLETDTSEIVNEVIYCIRKFGRMVLIADYTGPTNHFNIGAMMEKHLYVSGGQATVQKHWKMVLRYIQDGTFDPTICLTHYGKLSDAPDFYDKFNRKVDGVIKVFLQP